MHAHSAVKTASSVSAFFRGGAAMSSTRKQLLEAQGEGSVPHVCERHLRIKPEARLEYAKLEAPAASCSRSAGSG